MNKVKGNKLGRNFTGKQQIGNKNNQRDHIEEYENNSNRNKSQILADTQFISQSSLSNLSIKKVVLFPGEEYEFNEKLIHHDAFGFTNVNLVGKKCGILLTDSKGKALEETNEEVFRSLGKYYSPKVDDPVIGIIVQKSSEFYKVDINSYTHAILNTKDFEGATKKQKPNLNLGDLVFARISKVNKFDTPTLSCINPLEHKNWASGESYFGGIKNGNLFSLNRMHTWTFYKENYALTRLNDVVGYEIIIGFNGRMWINSEKSEDIYTIHEILINSLIQSKDKIEKSIHVAFIDKMKE
jgi:exosome complex RNA-binding protein Rrp4